MRRVVADMQRRQLPGSVAARWWPRLAVLVAAAGLLVALAAGAAVLAHPPLFAQLRPWWPPLAAIGLVSTAAGYWLLWGRDR